MEITYNELLTIVCILLFGILVGFQLMKILNKKELNENQLIIYNEVKNYAKIVYDNLKEQYGNEDELKAKIIQMVATEFPSADQKLIQIAIDFIFSQAGKLLTTTENQTS